MRPRTIVIGCSAVALLSLAVIGVGSYFAFRHLTSPAPLPRAATLAAPDSVALAQIRLEEGNAWVKAVVDHLARHSQSPPRAGKLTPLELVWSARAQGSTPVGHLVAVSLAPSGRFMGLIMDASLWKAGRAGEPLTRRLEHRGEGLTAFPGARLPGYFFARAGTIAWGSDEDAARRGVDWMVASEGGDASAQAGTSAVLSLFPADGAHAVRGALIDRQGSLARLLSTITGGTPPPTLPGVSGLAFVLDPASGTEAAGEVRLSFAPDSTPESRQQAASDLAAWLRGVSVSGVTLEAEARPGEPDPTVAVKASGLDHLFDSAVRAAIRARRSMEGGGAPPEDDQSSSTFQ